MRKQSVRVVSSSSSNNIADFMYSPGHAVDLLHHAFPKKLCFQCTINIAVSSLLQITATDRGKSNYYKLVVKII